MINFFECERCNKKITIEIEHPSICFKCHLKSVDNKKIKWREIRRFSYHMLLYVPIVYMIGFYGSAQSEFLYVLGGIHLAVLPYVRDWLIRIF